MRRSLGIIAAALSIGFAGAAHATPSTILMIPSVDVQPFGVVHFGADIYSPPAKGTSNGTNTDGGHNIVVYGLTVGAIPADDKFGMEVGVDYKDFSGNSMNPLYLNAKLGVKEGAFGEMSPAVAVGGYDFGTKSATSATNTADFRTDNNIMYGLVAKTFGAAGRFSVGYFSGNDKVLTDSTGKKDATGLLAAWEKTLNDKWWVAVDYMGSKSSYGCLNLGFAYTVSEKSSFIIGYNIYNDKDIGGKNMNGDTIEFNYDVNF